MKTTLFGFTLITSLIVIQVPFINYLFTLLHIGLGEGLSPVFKVVLFQIFLYSISFILSYIFTAKLELKRRLPTPLSGKYMIWIGGLIMISPTIFEITILMFEGGSSYYLPIMTYLVPVVTFAKILFFIGIFRLALAIKPNSCFTYEE